MQSVTLWRDWLNRTLCKMPDWWIYIIGAVPVLWLYWRALTGQLGFEPVEVIEHKVGLWGLWLMLAGLFISPLRQHLRFNLMKFRRAIGLLGFAYILVHLLTWAILDVQSLERVWADILKRPYITIGMLAFVLTVPLAATSWNGAIQRMGMVAWRRLHRLTYPAVILGALHFVMLRKGWQLEPILYCALAIGLVMLRLWNPPKRSGPGGSP